MRAIIFQFERINASKKELDMVRHSITKKDHWTLIEVLGDSYVNLRQAQTALNTELMEKSDLLIAHLSDWRKFQKSFINTPNVATSILTPQDCVMFTTQENQPCKKEVVSPFVNRVHYISKDKLALYISDILDEGSGVIDKMDSTERKIRELLETVSPYCFLQPEYTIQKLIDCELIKKQYEPALRDIGQKIGIDPPKVELWFGLCPRELIFEFREYL